MKPTCAEVRDHLMAALAADLIGPFGPSAAEELLAIAPSRWYLSGFLAPEAERTPDEEEPEDDALGGDETQASEELTAEVQKPRLRRQWPASIGLTVLLPAAAKEVEVTVRWADYFREEPEGPKGSPVHWRRVVALPARQRLGLDAERLHAGVAVERGRGLVLVGQLRATEVAGLPPGCQALSLFVVNRRPPVETRGRADEAFAFGVSLELASAEGLLPRPEAVGAAASALVEWDDRVAALQYRAHREYAVGHGIATEVLGEAARPTAVRTTWLPMARVLPVETPPREGITLGMEALARLDGGVAVHGALDRLVTEYGRWIGEQRAIPLSDPSHRETANELLKRAEEAKRRIAAGIALLADDAEVRRAFCLANAAMAQAARQRKPPGPGDPPPSWRLFQLAFILLSLEAIAKDEHPDRALVELIFFPTGGGKTEAYLGVIAVALLLRRLRGQARPDKGLGVAVLLRYTLRLLTLDQLGRAATLICALEELRKGDAQALGQERFALGLWVGSSATANTLEQVKKQIEDYRNNASPRAASPFPLPACPWCRCVFEKSAFSVADSEEVVVRCSRFECPFAAGLPVLFVDEHIYRELPAFLIATVDKFALLPWRGETGALFGRVDRRVGRTFYGPMDRKAAKGAERLPDGLRPPEIIVQDELHLIAGPLGTMVGLYETAIDTLCTRTLGGATLRPKIFASTATVKRAGEQIRALYGRQSRQFPPPGIDESDNFFARTDTSAPGRIYLGLGAPGQPMKKILIRTYVALLTAARAQFAPAGGARQPADPYMTLVGYFNSLRELGGMRRLVEDEVTPSCKAWHKRTPVSHRGENPWFVEHEIDQPCELTSRETTSDVAQAKEALGRHAVEEGAVDVVLASNMISVGVDIERLGLMVVAGQPKSTSEYIQATSRVGRDRDRPGLVVTIFNLHKARDRSHYEHFCAYHDSFYRHVESTSVTPFAGPALDRGLPGALTAMTRLSDPALTPPGGFMALGEHRAAGEAAVKALAERARALGSDESDEIYEALIERGMRFIDTWMGVIEKARNGEGPRIYSRFDRNHAGAKPVLSPALAEASGTADVDARFVCPTSMRDVEPSVHLWLVRG